MSELIIKDYRVNTLPVIGVPNSRYYVLNGQGTDIDEYVTDLSGNYHKVNPIIVLPVVPAVTSILVPYILGEVIGSGFLVYQDLNGKIYKFNSSDLNLYNKSLGITNQAGILNDVVDVVIHGQCSQMGGLVTGDLYYAGSVLGTVTNIPPILNIFQTVGIAKNTTTIILNFDKPYIKI